MANRKNAIRNNQANSQQTVATQTLNHYQGPIPPPDILRGLDELVPGTAARLIKLAEDESIHRRLLETSALDANIASQQQQLALDSNQTKLVFRSDLIGQLAGFLVCSACIAAATFLGLNGHDWLAAALAATPTGALIKAFVLNKKNP